VSSGFPTCRVVGLDAVQHLPLLLVVSEDGWVRVWDWMRRTRLAAHHLGSRQPLSCSLHTSGLMAAVGTTDGLLVFWILKVNKVFLLRLGARSAGVLPRQLAWEACFPLELQVVCVVLIWDHLHNARHSLQRKQPRERLIVAVTAWSAGIFVNHG